MKMSSRLLSVGTLLTLAVSQAQTLAASLVTGEQSLRNVQNLTHEIEWQTGLPQAEYQAKREHKLVFWMHMLGNLTGAT